ncbi:hypothetical protein [Falsiroseomonas sp. HW251]|uniref:hypothetical protein n=1 Tax=Falsiroseomonas sp. HW251 TaxID=3390998 RepID=UPI003D31654A
MKRVMLALLLGAPLAACAYVERPAPGYAQSGYVQPGYAQSYGYGAPAGYAPSYAAPATLPGYRDGSYEAERQAYEYGRRDGASAAQGLR